MDDRRIRKRDASVPMEPAESNLGLILALAFEGACIAGVQVILYALVAHVYPTLVRATGVGASAGIGAARGSAEQLHWRSPALDRRCPGFLHRHRPCHGPRRRPQLERALVEREPLAHLPGERIKNRKNQVAERADIVAPHRDPDRLHVHASSVG
jgi:hypothetical protein